MSEFILTKDKALVHHDSDMWEGWIRCDDMKRLQTYAADSTNVAEGISKWKAEPIPAGLMKKVLGTLARYEHTETGYVLYRDPINRKWDIRCPAQKGSAAHVNFFEEEHPDHQYQVVGTIHIHPQMHAFWSGTDMADQTKKPGSLHMVFGTSGKHVTETLCTVFEGNSVHYDIPFETVCEPVDFAADHQADEEWCAVIDKQEWTDPTNPAVPPVPAYTSQWQPLRTSYTPPARIAYNPRYEDPSSYFDYPLYDDRDYASTTTRRYTGSSKAQDLIESLAATCGCAVDLYGLDTVLSTIGEALGIDLDGKHEAKPAETADDDSCYDSAFNLIGQLNESVYEYDIDMAVDTMLDYIAEKHPEKLLDSARLIAEEGGDQC